MGAPCKKRQWTLLGNHHFSGVTQLLSFPGLTQLSGEQLSSAKAVADAPGAAKLSKMIGG